MEKLSVRVVGVARQAAATLFASKPPVCENPILPGLGFLAAPLRHRAAGARKQPGRRAGDLAILHVTYTTYGLVKAGMFAMDCHITHAS